MTDASGTTYYVYDDANRLTSLTNPFSQLTQWGYDDAGNRVTQGCLYDNLNQLIHCGTYSYDHDEVGNRTDRINPSNQATDTYTWDCLNRLMSYNNWNYQYRADGMRTLKRNNNSGTVIRYDGQMGMQDVELSGTGLQTWVSTTNYGLGARGVDYMEKTTSSGMGAFFPLYDLHGNRSGNTVSKQWILCPRRSTHL